MNPIYCYAPFMLVKGSRRLKILFLAMGFVTMVTQIIVMRRFIIVFGGNELVSGAVLAGWLGFSGMGNVIAGRYADRIIDKDMALFLSLIAMAIIIPITIAASMLVKLALGIPPPVIVGLTTVVMPILVILAPLGLAVGVSFTFACRLPELPDHTKIGRVYMFDTFGAAIGGFIFSMVAIALFSPVQASLITSAILIVSLGLAFNRAAFKVLSVLLLIIFALLAFFSKSIDSHLISSQWRGYNTAVNKESRLSSLMITDNGDERTMFVDGRPSFSLPLPETYETISNLPLIEHGNPRDVAIIEGGISGVLDQWKRWNLESAIFMRLDPEKTVLERFSMPSDLAEIPKWAKIIHGDGRRILKEGLPNGCRESCLDVVIVNVGDPDTAAADRYFTEEFSKEVKRILRPDGVFMIGLLEPANAISKQALPVLGTVRSSLKTAFARTVILPLDRFYFISSENSKAITNDTMELIGRLGERGMGEGFLATRVLAGIYPERVSFFENQIERATMGARPNTDTRPFAYLAGMTLWEERAGGLGSTLLRIGTQVRPWMGAALLVALLAFSLIFGKKSPARARSTFILAALGLSTIIYEVALLVHYQMSEGVLVWRVGLILTAFMVGAGLGAGLASYLVRNAASKLMFLISLALLAAYIPLQFAMTKISFILANFGIGLFGGWIYQLVASGLVGKSIGVGKAAGIVESSDHWGAAFGAIIASILIIPIFGLSAALIAADAAILAAMVIIVILRTPHSPNTIA